MQVNDELKLGSIILACCCFMWFYAIPNQIKGPQASLYPQSLTIVMSIISCLILIKGVRLRKNGEDGENWTFFNQATLRSLIVVPMMVVYVLLIEMVGFYAVTVASVVVFMLYFGARKPLSICLFSISLPLVIYLIIGKILSFPFPAGVLF